MFWILLVLWALDIITFWKGVVIWLLWVLVNVILYGISGALLYSAFVGLFISCLGG